MRAPCEHTVARAPRRASVSACADLYRRRCQVSNLRPGQAARQHSPIGKHWSAQVNLATGLSQNLKLSPHTATGLTTAACSPPELRSLGNRQMEAMASSSHRPAFCRTTLQSASHRQLWAHCLHATFVGRHRSSLAVRAAKAPQPPAVSLEDSKTKSFIEWAKQSKIKFSKLYPASFGGVRGIACSAPVKEEELLLTVPRDIAITLAPKQRNACPELVTDEFWKAAPWFAKLACQILYQKNLGTKSKLHTYLQQLPASVDAPVTWDQSQLQQLQYPHLIQQVGALNFWLTPGSVSGMLRPWQHTCLSRCSIAQLPHWAMHHIPATECNPA